MQFLTAVPQQPDYVALAMVLFLALIVAVMALKKAAGKKHPPQTSIPPVIIRADSPAPAAAPGSAGHVKIHDVPPKTAAMLMAIVADKLGKPLNELRFISIKEVK